jgi:hypothetical protein
VKRRLSFDGTQLTDRTVRVRGVTYCLRTWRRTDWRPFLSFRYTICNAGIFGFCFSLMHTYRVPETPTPTTKETNDA